MADDSSPKLGASDMALNGLHPMSPCLQNPYLKIMVLLRGEEKIWEKTMETLLHYGELAGITVGLVTLLIVGVIHAIRFVQYVWSKK
jgi:hypothetical protein